MSALHSQWLIPANRNPNLEPNPPNPSPNRKYSETLTRKEIPMVVLTWVEMQMMTCSTN